MEPPHSFFLPGQAGNLFAMYYPPVESETDAEDVLYIHPFAGEMFASRNVIATCARSLSAGGVGVLTVDLYGSGDSSGDFSEARWDTWRGDLMAALQWLQSQGRDRISLWGLRLGALLAMDLAAHTQENFERVVLWQPVVSGRNMLTQFFHVNLDEADKGQTGKLANPQQRSFLADNDEIEIAGYAISPKLIRAIDSLEINSMGKSVAAPIDWTEFSGKAGTSLAAESRRVTDEWEASGIAVSAQTIESSPFWLFPHCADSARLAEHIGGTFGVNQAAAAKVEEQVP
jgi:exosortase A-associated hydrolase 2